MALACRDTTEIRVGTSSRGGQQVHCLVFACRRALEVHFLECLRRWAGTDRSGVGVAPVHSSLALRRHLNVESTWIRFAGLPIDRLVLLRRLRWHQSRIVAQLRILQLGLVVPFQFDDVPDSMAPVDRLVLPTLVVFHSKAHMEGMIRTGGQVLRSDCRSCCARHLS